MPDIEGISIARHGGPVCKIQQFMGIQWCTFVQEDAIATNQYIGMAVKPHHICVHCVSPAPLCQIQQRSPGA